MKNKREIIVRIKGGLGNQLFQYAAAKYLSLKYDATLSLDTSWFLFRGLRDTPREFLLGKYDINFSEIDIFNCPWILFYNNRIFNKIPLNRKYLIITDDDIDSIEGLFDANKKIYMDGYWQSYSLLTDPDYNLSESFIPKKLKNKNFDILVDQISSTNSVSIHVRRGDYVESKTAARFHGTCSPNYYLNAAQEISKKKSDLTCFVFSDDINWATNNIDYKFFKKVIFINREFNLNPAQEINLMSRCEHNIIANSTFSWWGAWLNKNPNKIVICPAKWTIHQSQKNYLIPPGWIKI